MGQDARDLVTFLAQFGILAYKKTKKKSLEINRSSFKLDPGGTYPPGPSPDKYYRRCSLNFRIRNGNGCFPATNPTRNF